MRSRHAFALLIVVLFGMSFAAATLATEIPFHGCRGMICIDVSIDGLNPHPMLFDTGNVNSTLMADTAQSLGWKTEDITQDGKKIPGIQRGGEHTILLGDAQIAAKFLVFDRSVFGDNPPPVDGSLAYTFFKDRTLRIDYARHTINISDAGLASASKLVGKLELITFGKDGPPILVGSPFTVNGKSLRAQIDTCYSGTLLVYDAAVDELGLNKNGKPEFFPDTDGGVNMLASTTKNIAFEKTKLGGANPKVYFVGEGKNPVHQPDNLFEATVGNALLKGQVVTLDFHAMTFDVQPSK